MIWWYLIFAGSCVYGLSEGENLLSLPAFWISGLVVAGHLLVRGIGRKSKARPANTPSGSFAGVAVSQSSPELDMFEGLRGWNEDQTSSEAAIASCSLSGRSAAYLRSLLTAAVLRNDDRGKVIAVGTRRLLHGQESPSVG